jgi:fibronectin type 3 domain-containing protein
VKSRSRAKKLKMLKPRSFGMLFGKRFKSRNMAIFGLIFAAAGTFIILKSLALTPITCTTTISPGANVSSAFNAMSAGQTLCLKAGNYGSSTTVTWLDKSGTSGNPITLTTAPGETQPATINGEFKIGNNSSAGYRDNITVSHIKINANNLNHGRVNASYGCSSTAASGVTIHGSNIIFEYNDVSEQGVPPQSRDTMVGVSYNHTASNIIIRYNKIHDYGACDHFDHGIYWDHVNGGQIYGNWIWNPVCSYTTGDPQDRGCGSGIQLWDDPSNTQVYSNVIDGTGIGLYIAGYGSNNNVHNNVISNQRGMYHSHSVESAAGYSGYAGNSTNQFVNNIVFNSGPFCSSSCTASASGNITSDPLFTNPAPNVRDYTLKSGSPAAGYGLWNGADPFFSGGGGTPDTTYPTASITAPPAGATVAGTVAVTANASDNVGIAGVQFKLDGVNLGPSLATSPYSYSWNTTTVSNGTHTLTAIATDTSGNATTSSSTPINVSNTVAAVPSVPTGLTATPGDAQVVLNWNANPSTDNISHYNVYRIGQTFTGPWDQPTTTTFTNRDQVVNGTQYCYTISATNASGESARTAQVCATPQAASDTTVPTVTLTSPANGATVSGSSVTISANASDNVGVNNVEFFVDGSLLASDTSSPYSTVWNSTAVPNGTHTIMAKAYDAARNSSSSTFTVTVNNADTTPPSAPTGFVARAISPTQVDLAWTASTDNVRVTAYYIQRNGVIIGTATGTSYSDLTVTGNTTYTYVIIATDGSGNKTASSSQSVTTPAPADTTAPTAPTNLSGVAASSTQVNLSWSAATDPSGIKGYNVYRNGVKINSALVMTTSYGDSTATAGATYSYTVTAVDGANNESAKSTAVSVTTPDLPPPPFGIILGPTDDSYVDNNKKRTASNFGTISALNVNSGTQSTQYSLLKFNVSGVGTRVVTQAKLRLYVGEGSQNGGRFHQITNNSWAENSVTWNNKPAFNSSVLASLSAVNQNTWVEVDLTTLISGDGVYSVLIDSNLRDLASYGSKESASKPQLIIGVQ